MGFQVLDDDKRHPSAGRQLAQKLYKSLEPASGSADSDYMESFVRRFGLFVVLIRSG